jgi:mannose-1-phosphate guanylyltransferase
MKAMLLCAGLSTRLGPLGAAVPKPLLPVCDLPILRYGIALLTGHGIRDIVINLHHRGELFRAELGDGSAFGARIQYIEEPVILGTGGGLKNALPLLDPDGSDEPFLSMNGKLIFDLDLAALLAAHRPEHLGTLVVRRVPDAVAWGAVQVDEDGLVRDILGQGQHMFCGVHVTRPSVVRRLPDGDACMIRQGYLSWLRAGEPVAAFDAGDVYFQEHSVPARYLRSSLDLLAGARLRHPPGPLRGVDDSAHVHPTARLRHPLRIGPGAHIGEDAVIGPGAVIGAHAIVEPAATVERAVVWPRTRVAGAVADAIVTPQGLVPATADSPS